MRKRNAGVGAAAGRGRDAGYDLECDAVLPERERFLAAAAEQIRITALESPHDMAAFPGQVNDDLVDLPLWYAVPAG